MKKSFAIIFLYFSQFSFAQNLVNNWSFEDTVACPDNLTQIDRALGWSSYRESPDYFNGCAAGQPFTPVNVPDNVWGYQFGKSGNAYAGFTTFGIASSNFREYIGSQLNQPTQIGVKYFVSFFVSRAANANGMQYASNNIGMRFATTPYSYINPSPINNIASVYDSTIISDTLGWSKISGSFISDSVYNYAMFGNFFDDSLTSWIQIGSNLGYAYYYIDDIKISADSNYVNSIQEVKFSLQTIYPNLARDWIEIRGNNIQRLEIYDIAGKAVFKVKDIISPQKIDVSHFANGIYIVKALLSNKLIINKFVKN